MNSFTRTVRDAVRYYMQHGYSSEKEMSAWMLAIRVAANEKATSESELAAIATGHLRKTYDTQIMGKPLFQRHQGVSRFSVDALRPEMRRELDRRIVASANLIKLNRQKAIGTTLSRFSGWATSIPPGAPSSPSGIIQIAQHIEKTAAGVEYAARRLAIDQGHKLISNIDNVIATTNDAIAMEWHSHWRQPGYDYREDHKERDKVMYLIRGSWALKKGLIVPGSAKYLDEVTQPGEEVFCRCYGSYIYAIRNLPREMLTEKALVMLK